MHLLLVHLVYDEEVGRRPSASHGVGLDLQRHGALDFGWCYDLVCWPVSRRVSTLVLECKVCDEWLGALGLGVGVDDGELGSALGLGIDCDRHLLISGDFVCGGSVATQSDDFGVDALDVAWDLLLERDVRGDACTAVIGWKLVRIDVFEQLLFPGLAVRDDLDLGCGSWIQPSLDNLPGGAEETRSVDNVHFGHGFWETYRINGSLLLDDGESAGVELRQGKP
mmetsp:Transcript_1744/g.4822  ORF Transcript_1744/g.4822 Transcript_1744/m.4822 type:complete len:224 (-) Transcript_1744:803-1474(-)